MGRLSRLEERVTDLEDKTIILVPYRYSNPSGQTMVGFGYHSVSEVLTTLVINLGYEIKHIPSRGSAFELVKVEAEDDQDQD